MFLLEVSQAHAYHLGLLLKTKAAVGLISIPPACHERETSGNLLFNKRSDTAVHTDVAQRVHLVANSGQQQEI